MSKSAYLARNEKIKPLEQEKKPIKAVRAVSTDFKRTELRNPIDEKRCR